MDGDVFAKRKQTHPMPCRDGESSVVTFNALELAALLDGLLRGSIDATGGLGEVQCRQSHIVLRCYEFHQAFQSFVLIHIVEGLGRQGLDKSVLNGGQHLVDDGLIDFQQVVHLLNLILNRRQFLDFLAGGDNDFGQTHHRGHQVHVGAEAVLFDGFVGRINGRAYLVVEALLAGF